MNIYMHGAQKLYQHPASFLVSFSSMPILLRAALKSSLLGARGFVLSVDNLLVDEKDEADVGHDVDEVGRHALVQASETLLPAI